MRWQRVEVRGVAPRLWLELPGRDGELVESGRVRDVLGVARVCGGVEVERWVKGCMGFGGEGGAG